MDWHVVLFLVLIVLSGGFIGVLADETGRRIGKMRLSFRKIRPRHTARIIAFLTGFIVAILTIAVTSLASSGVRDWIIYGQQALARARQLTAQNTSLEKKISGDVEKESALHTQLTASQNQITANKSQLALVRTQLVTAQTQVKYALKKVTAIGLDIAAKRMELNKDQAQLKTLRAQSRALQNQINYLTQDNNSVQDRNLQLTRENDAAKANAAALQSSLDTLNLTITNLNDKIFQETGKLSTAQTRLTDLTSQVDSLQKQRDKLQASMTELSKLGAFYQDLAGSVRTKKLLFTAGEELARVDVPPFQTDDDATATINHLLDLANTAAKDAGASTFYTTAQYAVVPPVTAQDGTEEMTPTAQVAQWVEEAKGEPVHTLFIVSSLVNAFKGEAVLVTVKRYPNPVAFHKGEIIAEQTFDRKWSPDEVLAALDSVIQHGVVDKALSRGMIRAEGQTGSLLNIPASKTLQLVLDLTHTAHSRTLIITSNQETRVGDPLSISFTLK